jgi:hypothetical protein
MKKVCYRLDIEGSARVFSIKAIQLINQSMC